jgi:hypothetical protein
MKTFVLILLLNTWQGDGKGAIEKVEGFSSIATCQEAGKVFENSTWAQYTYCIEVK